MDRTEIKEIVLKAQAGDREAFGTLVEVFQDEVMFVAMRKLGNYAEAQELVQDVFIQAMRKIEQLKQPESFGGWLRSIAIRMGVNQAVRRRYTTSAEQETLEAICVQTETPYDVAIVRERETQLRAGMERLKPLDRDTLQSFYMEGNSIEQMSNKFESPVGTIKRRLHMARKRLADELSDMVSA